MPATDATTKELLDLTERLLAAIAGADWATYAELCDPTLTAFEPEAVGHRVEGLAFHRFYFQLGSSSRGRQTTVCDPHVRVMGDVAVVTYVRLTQATDGGGAPRTSSCEETRVWQKQNGQWRHVHFHRSDAARWPE